MAKIHLPFPYKNITYCGKLLMYINLANRYEMPNSMEFEFPVDVCSACKRNYISNQRNKIIKNLECDLDDKY